MGRVWAARNQTIGAEVAAKVLLPAFACPEGLARFRREAEAAAALSHRAIVRVFDLVELDPEKGSLVLIMELLRGRTLARRIAQLGPFSVEDTLGIALPLLSALSHAHALGIVHRDLKPENVLLAVDPDGHTMPKLIDFGISKRTRSSAITLQGEIVGTPAYMSPEQSLGREVDLRTDVFSMGILLYECLSGMNPFAPRRGGMTTRELMCSVDVEPKPLTDLPPALWRVLERAMAKRPENRFESAAALADALVEATRAPVFTARARAASTRASRRGALGLAIVSLAASVMTIASASPERGHRRGVARRSGDVPTAVHHDKIVQAPADVLRVRPPVNDDVPVEIVRVAPVLGRADESASRPAFLRMRPAPAARAPLASKDVGVVRDPLF